VDNLGAIHRPRLSASEAHDLASARARDAGVELSELRSSDEFATAAALLAQIWGTSVDAAPLPADLLASFVHAGSCVVGARDGDRLVGLAVCLAGAPHSSQVYSLIAGSTAEVSGRGVGIALKFGQRAWALDRGAERMVWTFDPLVRRNAHFNLTKLGARAVEYLPDFYPPMHDTINRQDLTDRLVVRWELASPAVELHGGERAVTMVGQDGVQRPVLCDPGRSGWVGVEVPADIEVLRRTDPALAREWRLTLRRALTSLLSGGYRIAGFARGGYLLQRGPDD
jgi:predicted GNAT superfamily acetyltransferase